MNPAEIAQMNAQKSTEEIINTTLTDEQKKTASKAKKKADKEAEKAKKDEEARKKREEQLRRAQESRDSYMNEEDKEAEENEVSSKTETSNNSEEVETVIESTNESISTAKPGDKIRRKDGTIYTLNQGDIDYAKKQIEKAKDKTDVETSKSQNVSNSETNETKVEEVIEETSDDASLDEVMDVATNKAIEEVVKEQAPDLSKKEQKALEKEAKKKAKDETKAKAKEELKKDNKSTYLKMKDALEKGIITERDYKHFLFDRIMTSIGKALGTFISRDPQWLFYKDQWAQRNANLLKQNLDKDRAKVIAGYSDEERKAAMEAGDLHPLSQEELSNTLYGDTKAKLEVTNNLEERLNSLYVQKEEIGKTLKTLESGEYDLREFGTSVASLLSSIGGIQSSTSYTGNNTTTNEQETAGSTKGGGGSIGLNVGPVQIGANGKLDSTKGTTSGNSKLLATNNTSTIDNLAKDWLNVTKKAYSKNSPQIERLTEELTATLRDRITYIDSQISAIKSQINEINNTSQESPSEDKQTSKGNVFKDTIKQEEGK